MKVHKMHLYVLLMTYHVIHLESCELLKDCRYLWPFFNNPSSAVGCCFSQQGNDRLIVSHCLGTSFV